MSSWNSSARCSTLNHAQYYYRTTQKLYLTPVQTRWSILILKFLKYTLALQGNHLVSAAITNSVARHISGRENPGLSMTRQAACNLPFSLPYDLDPWSLTPDYIDVYLKMVLNCVEGWLQQTVDSSNTLYLLHDRKKPAKNKSPRRVTPTLRHYLKVKIKEYRNTLIWTLLLSHACDRNTAETSAS